MIKPISLPDHSEGRWHRVFDGALSVKWFGATGLGKVDDSGEIGLALAAANGAGRVHFPAGTYLCRKALSVPAGLDLTGESMWTSTLLFTGGTDGLDLFDGSSSTGSALGDGNAIRDLGIQGTVAGTHNAVKGQCGINIRNRQLASVERCFIRQWNLQGIYFNQTYVSRLAHCLLLSCALSPSPTYGAVEVDGHYLAWEHN